MKTFVRLTMLPIMLILLQLPAWGETGASPEKQLKEGMARYAKQDYAGAIRELEEALKKHPEDVRVLFYLGYAYYKHGDFEDARETFEEAYRLQPSYTPLPKAQTTSPSP